MMLSILFCISAAAQEQNLFHHLMRNYTKEIRPVKNFNESIEVILHPTFEYLVEVDELRESFTALFWFSMMWHDDYLIWKKDDFDGQDEVHLPALSIWRPDLMIYGAVKQDFALPLESTVAKVRSNGRVVLELTQVVKMFCPFDIELFPFDTQNCTIRFGSWSFRSNRVSFQSFQAEGNTDFLKDQPEWNVVSFKATLVQAEYGDFDQTDINPNETFSELSYEFIFRRKPVYYIFNLIIPSFIITLLSLVGLFVPFSSSTERQEKVTLGLTSLLAMALILNLVSEEVPKTSRGIPILGRFILYQLIIISTAVLNAVLIMVFHRTALLTKRSPSRKLLKLLFIDYIDKPVSHYSNGLFHTEQNNEQVKEPISAVLTRALLVNEIIKCKHYLQSIASAMTDRQTNKHRRDMWTRVFDRFDFCCLIVYTLANILMSLLLLFRRG